MPSKAGRASSRATALAEVFREPSLRRVELAWTGYYVAEWTSFVALSVYAYGFGGATAVGVLGLVRAVPAAVGVPAGSAFQSFTLELVLTSLLVLAGRGEVAHAVAGAQVLVGIREVDDRQVFRPTARRSTLLVELPRTSRSSSRPRCGIRRGSRTSGRRRRGRTARRG